MEDLEDVLNAHLKQVFGVALQTGNFIPTANLLYDGKPARIVTGTFGWRDANEEYTQIASLRAHVRATQPAAVMLIIEANLSTPKTRETPSRKVLVDIQFPDAPRQFQIYEIIRDELGRVRAIQFKATAPSTAFNGMNVFDPPTTH